MKSTGELRRFNFPGQASTDEPAKPSLPQSPDSTNNAFRSEPHILFADQAHNNGTRGLKSSRWLIAFCVVLASLSLGPVARAQEQAGFVLEKSGEWFLDKNRTQSVSEGDKLPAGAEIWPATSNPQGSYITVSLYTGEPRAGQAVTKPGEEGP